MKPRSEDPSSGVVTFLDVLGWKGVYDRKQDAIGSLTLLIEGARKEAEKKRGRIRYEVTVKSISDTIAIFTFAEDFEVSDVIEVHGEICQWLIRESIDAELPVRGAIAYGEFQIRDNIFVGKGIDEAASWHEQSDWIGVNLTPSAEFVFEPRPKSRTWHHCEAPLKNRLKWATHCVNWTSGWKDRGFSEAAVRKKFLRLGPIVPEIAGKFTNTLAFITAAGVTPLPKGKSKTKKQPEKEG